MFSGYDLDNAAWNTKIYIFDIYQYEWVATYFSSITPTIPEEPITDVPSDHLTKPLAIGLGTGIGVIILVVLISLGLTVLKKNRIVPVVGSL